MTPQEFYAKCEWEGGVFDGILGYGLNETDLDVQEGEFYEAVKALAALREPIDKHVQTIIDIGDSNG